MQCRRMISSTSSPSTACCQTRTRSESVPTQLDSMNPCQQCRSCCLWQLSKGAVCCRAPCTPCDWSATSSRSHASKQSAACSRTVVHN
jgi:hypothetical protein